MKSFSTDVCAKVNLVLNIVGTDCRGYHLLDSVAAPLVGLFDTITVTCRSDRKVTAVFDDGTEVEGNTAYKAGVFLRDKYSTGGMDIVVTKRIPLSSGLGGSSADAAGVAICMSKLFGITPTIEDLAAISADVPFMFEGRSARMQGVGEKLTPIAVYPYEAVVLVGGGGLRSRNIYREYDCVGGECGDVEVSIAGLTRGDADVKLFNALTRAAGSTAVAEKLKILADCNINSAVMSGSGDAVVGIARDLGDKNALTDKLKDTDYIAIFTKIKDDTQC